MKKFYVGCMFFMIFIFAFSEINYGNKSCAQLVSLESNSMATNVVELLQYKSINNNNYNIIYFVEYMLNKCGLDKKWVKQLPISEKKKFFNAESIQYYNVNIDENREICIIVARFSIQEKVYRYHMVVCITSNLVDSNGQDDCIWICFPSDCGEIVLNKDSFQMSQWFTGDRIRGKIFYDTTQEQLNFAMKKFDFNSQNYNRNGIDQCIYYIAEGFVYNLKKEENKSYIPFAIYYQPNVKFTVGEECESIEMPKLNELNIMQITENKDVLQYSIKEGWIGVGNIPIY